MRKCARGLEVKPLQSAAGWYLGTFDKDGPRCRVSLGYRATAEEAEHLDTERCDAMENRFCAGGNGCQITYADDV